MACRQRQALTRVARSNRTPTDAADRLAKVLCRRGLAQVAVDARPRSDCRQILRRHSGHQAAAPLRPRSPVPRSGRPPATSRSSHPASQCSTSVAKPTASSQISTRIGPTRSPGTPGSRPCRRSGVLTYSDCTLWQHHEFRSPSMANQLYCPNCQTTIYSSIYLGTGTHICPTCSTGLINPPQSPPSPPSSDSPQH